MRPPGVRRVAYLREQLGHRRVDALPVLDRRPRLTVGDLPAELGEDLAVGDEIAEPLALGAICL